MAIIKLDPVTRLEGHLKIEVEIDSTNKVVSAHSTGNLFRGFEKILQGKDPRDAVHITQRICGLCPVSHSIAATKAVEKAFNFAPNINAIMVRNLIQGANYLSDHILHFYHLALLDYAKGPAMSPWTPGYATDYRFTQAENDALIGNYVKALEIRRKAHEMCAIFAGKIPHVMTIIPGGVTEKPTAADITNFKNYLTLVTNFINTEYNNDVNLVASKYSDYYNVGRGVANFLTSGLFDTNTSGSTLFVSGVMTNGVKAAFDQTKVAEFTKYSWYTDASTGKNPASGETTPAYGKAGAYTWLKAPRYNGEVYEVGPLARMMMNGEYTRGTSVMDRHMARFLETKKIAENMLTWVNSLSLSATYYTKPTFPINGVGFGFTEAPRGALGHWVSFTNQAVTNYQVLTPTCWNASPRDDAGKMGALEQALVGVTLANPAEPVELLRIIHSFDPCTGCSVHVVDADKQVKAEFVVSTPNPIGVL